MAAPQATDDKPAGKENGESKNGTGANKQTWKQGNNKMQTKHPSKKFTGEISELNGNVYELHNETSKANQFQKTTKAIAAYANRTMKAGNDMMNLLDNMKDLDFIALTPKRPESTGDEEIDKMILQQEVNDYVKRKKLYYENRDKLYTIIWGQCSESLQAKLKGTKAYVKYNPIKCPLSLLADIKQISLKFENVTFKAFAIHDAKRTLSTFYQGKQDTLHQYYLKFKDLTDALEHYGAELGNDIGLIRDVAERNGEKDIDDIDHTHEKYLEYKKEAREQYLAVSFLRGADRAKYGHVVMELENDYTKGTNHIPTTLAGAYSLLDHIKVPQKTPKDRNNVPNGTRNKDNDNEIYGLVFVNKNGKQIGKDVQCYDCGGNHYKGDPECPNSKITQHDGYPPFPHRSVAFLGAQPSHDPMPNKNWILLDNQSSEHIFKNKNIVTSIHTVAPSSGLTIYSNGGCQFTHQKAVHQDFGTVWFNPNAITNILSFSKLRNAGHHLSYDYKSDIYTLIINDRKFTFRQSPEGLYIHDYGCDKIVCVTTVTDKQRKYTPRQISAADEARKLYRMLGRPSERTFKHMLNHGLIANTTITSADVIRASDIYGPEVGCLKGKSVRQDPTPVRIPTLLSLPDEIKARHRNVTLCADICHVDGLRFLTTISRHIHFGTIEFVPSLDHAVLLTALKNVITVYQRRGFTITWILTDRAFEHLRDALLNLDIDLNTTAANEHVPEIERYIRVIKERVRSVVTTSPINPMPNTLKIHLLHNTVQMLNLTVQPNGVSDFLSPSAIVLGRGLDTKIYCRVEFGSYCQVHDDPSPTNNVHLPRTIDAIALRPLGNLQGGYYFLDLNTWRVVARRSWSVLPMPAHVLELLHTKAHDERAHGPIYLRQDYFHFRHSDKSTLTSFLDDDNHLLLYPFLDEGADHPTETDLPAETDLPEPNPNPNPPPDNDTDDIHFGFDSTSDDDDNVSDADSDDDDDVDAADDSDDDPDIHEHMPDDATDSLSESGAHPGADPGADDSDMDSGASPALPDTSLTMEPDELLHLSNDTNDYDSIPNDVPSNSLTAAMQQASSSLPQRNSQAKDTILPNITSDNIISPEIDDRPSTTRYSMRPRTTPRYATDGFSLVGFSMAIACTQMTAKEGLKRFGKDAEDALLIEWKQLDDLKVYSGVHWNDLTPEERSRALRLVQLLKLKRCGQLRGRTCADGRKQRKYILPEDASSPTVSTEALLMTCVIDAKERRHVATADVPGAFLHADMDDIVHVIVEGEQLALLIKSNPKYKMFVHVDKRTGKERAYLRLHKALYGTLKAARLFYEDLAGHLEEMGFEANPYDPCVMNRNIQGSQCTVAWHVDDLKISHKSQAVVDRILKRLSDIYGDLSITRGPKHTFVGMDLEFGNGEVKVSMESYLHESLELFPEQITGTVSSPAANHLYTVNPNAKKLHENLREIFHSIVAKLLFVTTRARPDLQPTISFLTSRCAVADVDDWKKLKRLLCYIKETINLKLRLRANAMNIVMWWADAAFAVRDDYKSQSGRGMSLGTGMMQCKSNKQSTTENSSTTAEVISSSDALVMIIWTTNFLKAQGYPIRETILFQDNMSAIKLERNGRQSSSKRTRHLNIRHFFIKDRVQAGELNINHCGTDDMIADYFTKPLQGNKFKKFRDLILGITDIDSSDQIRSVLVNDLKWPNPNGNGKNGTEFKYENNDENMSPNGENHNEIQTE